MRVLELWRYPVKSLQGELLTEAHVGPLGIPRDRGWALFDRDTGLGLTARRAPELLFGAARVRPDGEVEVVLPDGTVTADDAVLSAWLGRPVTLRASGEVTGTRRAVRPRPVSRSNSAHPRSRGMPSGPIQASVSRSPCSDFTG